MVHSFRLVFVLAVLLADFSGAAQVGTPALVSIQTPRGATQAFILTKVDNPVASVVLFAGGYGALGLKNASSMKWGSEGFLVRSRDKFADHDFMVAGKGNRLTAVLSGSLQNILSGPIMLNEIEICCRELFKTEAKISHD